MNYTTKDFSDIYPPDVKPVNVGWYVASPFAYFLPEILSGKKIPLEHNMWWWSGIMWWTDKSETLAIIQDRYWFGLKEKP